MEDNMEVNGIDGHVHTVTVGPPNVAPGRHRVFLRLDGKGHWTRVTDEFGRELVGVKRVSYDAGPGGLPTLTIELNQFTLVAENDLTTKREGRD